MTYTVDYRGKNGLKEQRVIEAADRKDCFRVLDELGIRAIRVTEGGVVRKTRPAGQKPIRLGLVAGAVATMVAVLVGVWCLLDTSSSPTSESTPKDRTIKEARRDKTALPHHDLKDEIPATPVAAQVPVETSNELAKAETPKKGPKKPFRIIRKDEGKKKLFHNVADIYISRVVNSTPGNLVVGTINYDRFAEQLEKALKQPITIDPDDTPEEVAKKQAVIETRKELKEMLDRGEDIAKVMRESEEEMRRLYNYRRTIHLELARAMKEKKFNADDMQDYVNAANKILTENGMEPLKHPEMWVRRMRQEEALQKQ